MKVQDILHKKGSNVISVDAENTVFNAIALMSDTNVGALVVMYRGKLAGMISERDYRDKVILKGKMSKETPVKDIMSKNVICVTPEHNVHDCMAIMSDKKIRHLPVLDEKSNIVGIISIGDIVKSIIDEQNSEIRNLRDYITSSYPG